MIVGLLLIALSAASPARFNASPIVDAAGQLVWGSFDSSQALSFFGPQLGCCRRASINRRSTDSAIRRG
jgi:hypothetical protein